VVVRLFEKSLAKGYFHVYVCACVCVCVCMYLCMYLCICMYVCGVSVPVCKLAKVNLKTRFPRLAIQ
jgi:hypothetical protein